MAARAGLQQKIINVRGKHGIVHQRRWVRSDQATRGTGQHPNTRISKPAKNVSLFHHVMKAAATEGAIGAARGATMGATTGAVFGGVGGTALGPGHGTLAGIAMGSFVGAKTGAVGGFAAGAFNGTLGALRQHIADHNNSSMHRTRRGAR